jgi:WASH complex subunit CCDC53
MTVRQDPRFSKYFKMVEMGVPFPAVQNKFAAETGMNPAILA